MESPPQSPEFRNSPENFHTWCKTATLKDQKLVFKTDYHLMQVKKIEECSKGSILH